MIQNCRTKLKYQKGKNEYAWLEVNSVLVGLKQHNSSYLCRTHRYSLELVFVHLLRQESPKLTAASL